MPKGVVNCVNCDINGGGGPITSACVKAYVEEVYPGTNPPNDYTTYRLLVDLVDNQQNLYAIYGDAQSPICFPPAFHAIPSFGANIGGTNPALADVPDSEYDSWLTIGITDGDTSGALYSTGLDFTQWTTGSGLSTTDGSVFWMNPANTTATGPDIVIAQLTVPTGEEWTATCGLKGQSVAGDDWTCEGVEWKWSPPTK